MANSPALPTLHGDTRKSKKSEVRMCQHQIKFLYRVSSTFIWLWLLTLNFCQCTWTIFIT